MKQLLVSVVILLFSLVSCSEEKRSLKETDPYRNEIRFENNITTLSEGSEVAVIDLVFDMQGQKLHFISLELKPIIYPEENIKHYIRLVTLVKNDAPVSLFVNEYTFFDEGLHVDWRPLDGNEEICSLDTYRLSIQLHDVIPHSLHVEFDLGILITNLAGEDKFIHKGGIVNNMYEIYFQED